MSRRAGLVKPEVLWTSDFAVALREQPPECFKVAVYLLTGPTSETWGIWHLERSLLRAQTGVSEAKVGEAFAFMAKQTFAFYDEQTGYVWMPQMAPSQFLEWPLKPGDNKVRWAKHWYAQLPENPFLGPWWDRFCFDLYLNQPPDVVENRGLQKAAKGERSDPEGSSVAVAVVPAFDLLGEVRTPIPRTRARGNGAPPSNMTAGQLERWLQATVEIYPRKEKIAQARVVLAKLDPTPALLLEITEALKWQTRQTQWLKKGAKYCPSLYRYLADQRWQDKPSTIPFVNESTLNAMSAIADFANEAPCETPEPIVSVSEPRSKRLRS